MKPNHVLSICPGVCRWGRRATVPAMLALMALTGYLAVHAGPVRGGTARYPKLPIVNVKLGNKTAKL